MKINESSSMLTSASQSSFMNLSSQNKIVCSSNNESQFACLNKKCQKYAFTCSNHQCECHKQHKGCLMVLTQTLTDSLMAKIISVSPLKKIIDQTVEKVIDRLSDWRDQILVQMKENFMYCGLNNNEKQLMTKLNSNDVKQITGELLWKAHLNFETVDQIVEEMVFTVSSLNVLGEELHMSVAGICEGLRSTVSDFDNNAMLKAEDLQNLITKMHTNSQKVVHHQLFKSSKISTVNQAKTLQSFFFPKKLKKTQLLYRASQNQFSINKFHQKCDNIRNTLILCQTQFGKKIGGFNPFPWEKKHCYKTDEAGDSFIFSLTNKDKFTLTKKDKAIYDSTYPQFGDGSDLILVQKANLNNSTCEINNTFKNEKYKSKDKDSYEKFSGNSKDSCYFKSKDWQVWKVQLE